MNVIEQTVDKERIALIAGRGKLPIVVADSLCARYENLTILCFDKDNFDFFRNHSEIGSSNIYFITLLDLEEILRILKCEKIKNVVCCGGVTFTGLDIRIFNFHFIKSYFFIIKYILAALFAKNRGDNFLLTLAEKVLKSIGCKVLAVQDILHDMPCSINDEINATFAASYMADITYGAAILNELSRFDIGQSIVVLNGRVLGIEGAEGTQELIKRCGKYYHDMCALNSNVRKRRPVLIKKSKLNQNQKLDMPTIGEQSIVDLVDNSFAGIALERDGVLMLDKPVIRQLCEKYNFFLKVM